MRRIICLLIIASHLSACSTYVNRAATFKPPQEYGNYQNVSGLMVGCEAFSDTKRAEAIFGFDIRNTGVFPVQIVMDNRSTRGVEIIPGQTFLADTANANWRILTNGAAVELVERGSSGVPIADGSDRGAAYGAAAGALLGLAIGVVAGHGVGEASAKSGASGGNDEMDREYGVAEDVREKGIDGRVIPAGSLAWGFIYFPGEAAMASELRLQVRFDGSNTIETLSLKLH